MSYTYSESAKVMNEATPLVTRADLLLICKEIDAETPEAETTDFIKTAHVLLCNILDGWGIAASLMEQIEKYLSAHFATLTYSSVQREALGPMSRSYMLKVDLGFNATRYGQMAIQLDPTGRLENFRKKNVSMRSIGSGIIVTE